MKITKLLSISFVSALMLTSCLGDSEMKIGNDESFAYYGIWGDEIRPSLNTSEGYRLQYSGNQIVPGDCAVVGYTIVNPTAGINVDENLTVKKVYSEDNQNEVNIVPELETNGDIYPTSFAVARFAYNDYLGDRWLMNMTTSSDLAASDVYVKFYYDKSRQVLPTKLGEYDVPDPDSYEPVKKNQVVIDVRVFKDKGEGSAAEVEVGKDKMRQSFVANFNDLRRQIKFAPNGLIDNASIIDTEIAKEQGYVDTYGSRVAILFRYIKEKKDNKDNKIYVESYSGSTGVESTIVSTAFYCLAYPSEQ